MKTFKITLFAAFLMLLLPAKSLAQDQLFWVHDDHVKPGMSEEYAKLTKELVAACNTHNIPNLIWFTIRMDNGTYRWVAPIANMAELDSNPFAPLAEKMGKEKLAALWEKMDKCYDRHNSFLVKNVKELNYMPEDSPAKKPGMDYQKYHFMYVTPSNSDAVAEKIKVLTGLYAKSKAPEHVRIYHSGLGCTEEFYVAVISAKDEADYIKTSDATEKILGDEGKKAMDDLFKIVSRYETVSGYSKPNLSYAPKK